MDAALGVYCVEIRLGPRGELLTVSGYRSGEAADCPMRILSAVTPTWATAPQAQESAAAAAEHFDQTLWMDIG